MASSIRLDLVLKGAREATGELKKINTTLVKTQATAEKTRKSFLNIGSVAKSAAKNILAFGAAFAGFSAIVGAVRNLVDFQTAVREIETILPNVGTDIDKLTKKLIDSSVQFGTSAAEQAKTFYQIISAGISDVTQANDVLINSNKLAIGGLTSTTQAVDIITSSLNAYASQNLTAQQAADALFTTVRLGKTRVDELASSLGQVLPIAESTGVSFQELTGAVARLTQGGIATSIAVTQVRSILSGLIKNQARATELLGDSADAFSLSALRAKGLTKFLADLNKVTKGSESTILKLLGRQEGLVGFLSLSKDGFVGLGESIAQVRNGAGAADAAFKKITNTIGAQAKILKASLSGIFLDISVNKAGLAVDFLRAINRLLASVRKNLNSFISFFLTGFIAVVAVGLFKLAVAFKVWAASVQVSSLLAATALKTFLAATGVGLLLVGLNLIIIKFLDLRDKVSSFGDVFKVVGNKIKIFFNNVQSSLAELSISLNQGIIDFRKNSKFLNKIFGDTSSFVKSANEAIKLQKGIIDNNKKSTASLTAEIVKLTGGLEGLTKAQEEQAKAEAKAAEARSNARQELEALFPAIKTLNSIFENGVKIVQGFGREFDKLDFSSTSGFINSLDKISGKQISIDLTATLRDTLSFVKEGKKGAQKLLGAGLVGIGESIAPGLGKALGPVFDALSVGPEGVKKFTEEFTKAIPTLIENFIISIPVFLETLIIGLVDAFIKIAERIDIIIIAFVKGMVKAAPNIAIALSKAMPTVAISLAGEMPTVAFEFGKSLIREAPKFIQKLISEVSGAFTGGIFGGGGGGGILSVFGLARGGIVPGQGNTDSVPALLTPWELVVPKNDASNVLNLNNSDLKREIKRTNNLLVGILGTLGTGQSVSTTIEIDGKKLGDAILNLNRNNARLASGF